MLFPIHIPEFIIFIVESPYYKPLIIMATHVYQLSNPFIHAFTLKTFGSLSRHLSAANSELGLNTTPPNLPFSYLYKP